MTSENKNPGAALDEVLREIISVAEGGRKRHQTDDWYMKNFEHIAFNADRVRHMAKAALTPAPVDVEGLKKRPVSPSHPELFPNCEAYRKAWNDCIDHLAASGHLQTPVKGWNFPYQKTFDAIASAVRVRRDDTLDISVEAFQDSFNGATPPATERTD
jgi:hypothetical protein